MLIPPRVFKTGQIAGDYPHEVLRLERQADGTPLAVATDGHRLLITTWDEADVKDFPVIHGVETKAKKDFTIGISSKLCGEAAKLCPAKETIPILSNVFLAEILEKNGRAILLGTDLSNERQLKPMPSEDSFPVWRKVLPDESAPSISIRLNAKMLAELAKLAAEIAYGSDRHNEVELVVPAKPTRHTPVLVIAEGDQCTATGVLMPLQPSKEKFERMRSKKVADETR